MAEKATTLILKVDLQCPRCYKKVKRVLCKIPQVSDQIYDEKKNTVTITVCCSPEKIRGKLYSKGGKSIQGIEIKEPSKPKDAQKPKPEEKPKPDAKPKEADKPKEGEKAKAAEKPKSNDKGEKPASEKPKEAVKSDPPKGPEPAGKALEVKPVAGLPAAAAFTYYGPSYEVYPMVPYYHGYGGPVTQPPPTYYDNYGYGYGYGRSTRVNQYDYFSEENPSACMIM